jgi:C-terminal processing protease CtpA/Prc
VAERKAEPTPPFNERNMTSMITQDIIRELYGAPGDNITLVYEGMNGDRVTAELELKERVQQKSPVISDLPDIYASAWGRLINDRIAYIRFNVFHPAIRDSVLRLIDEYIDKPGMIIDIRGNPGGEFNTRLAIAGKFVTERTLFWIYHSRDGDREVFLGPPDQAYQGEVVILVDELSGSSSEEFAGGMQAIGRATIVGNRTAGKVLTMEVMPLPDGAVLIYPDSQTRTSKNEILEGKGVIPDIEVGLMRSSLLEGRDPQLEAAVDHLTVE